METISKELFDANSIPSEIYNLTDDEKTNFDLSATPEADRTYSLCYFAVSYNPRQNIKHVPLNIFAIDDSLLFFNTYKRFYKEVPDFIERKVIEKYVDIKYIDLKTLVKYVKALEYPARVYYNMLKHDAIKYTDIPFNWRQKLITEISARDHQDVIKQRGWHFDDVPKELQLHIFDKRFMKFMLDRGHYKLNDIPEGYKPKKKSKINTVTVSSKILNQLTSDQTNEDQTNYTQPITNQNNATNPASETQSNNTQSVTNQSN